MNRSVIFVLMLCAAAAALDADEEVRKNLVGYFAAWNVHERHYFVKNIETTGAAEKLTHINYAFANISTDLKAQLGDADTDCKKVYSAENSVDGVADAPGSLCGSFNQLRKLKAKHPQLRVLISIGGWSWSNRFSEMALTPESRSAFVASCIELFIKGNFTAKLHQPRIFDGIDIDWEFPGAAGATKTFRREDRENFTALLAEFRKQLDAQGTADGKYYLLTIATSAVESTFSKLALDKIHPYLDAINVMTYDMHGSWDRTSNFQSALFPAPNDPSGDKLSCDTAMQGYLKAGVPAAKLNLGVPFYGRGWKGVAPGPDGIGLFQHASGPAPSPSGGEKGMSDFRELKKLGPAFVPHSHAAAGAFSVYNPDAQIFWTYDDPSVMAAKAAYIKSHNLGGAMIWELGGDDDEATLLSTLSRGLSDK